MPTFDLAVIGAGLPAAALVPTLREALARSGTAVVQAPPGTGKTTVVPPTVAGLTADRVVVTQPRRIAARAAARRLAQLTGTRLGDLVGYTVRGEQQVGPATRVEFVTTGVLVRRLLRDPDLPGVGAVVLDEVHERHLDSDLAVAMTREVAELRGDLLVVAMSATLDADRWAGLLAAPDPAPVVDVDAALFPLEVEWAPLPPGTLRLDARGITPAFLDHVARVTRSALEHHPEGDALVFVPGAREVGQVVSRLAGALGSGAGIDVLPLHGRLSSREQDAALAPGPRRRVVVSTSVAESSLTVPGVRLVVDAGLARRPAYDSIRGMAGLVTVSESRASAEQRAGRAARLGPGVVVRCFAEQDWARMDAYAPPEIATADLTSFALDVAVWGAPGGQGLALPDPPPAGTLAAAERTLTELGALADGHVTARGRAMAAVPADPRLARALLDGAERLGAKAAAEAVALVASDERPPGGDLAALLREFRRGGGPAAQRWRREADRLARLVPGGGKGSGRGAGPVGPGGPAGPSGHGSAEAALALVVAMAFPDRIAHRRGGRDDPSYLLASGTGAVLDRGSGLLGQEWLAIAQVERSATAGTTGAVIRSAVAIDEATALEAAAALLVEEEVGTWTGRKVSARKVRRLGAIELTAANVRPSPDVARAAVRDALREQGLGLAGPGVFSWTDNGRMLARRLALLHRVYGEPWPSMAEEDLLSRWQDWLVPEIDALVRGTPADRLDLTSALRRLLPWPQAGRLDELVPERIEVPTGSHVRIDYPEIDDPDGRPVLAVKLQECFGMTRTPTVCEGRVKVLLHLLSPARRPLAITDDLPSFWVNAYPQVRAENRGRYPKHPWPEDPLTAPPRRGTTRSGR
ncbi:ATP-dependent helicase HrpB [Raineyella antarctica]|uniref:ATP-dependent helicase HrpB n=1 Tax=Raineyella antarctica TaxID=1577474 RepID=A0A1G6GEP9_9ACTN|nr:ATP-dependent helicase HrpB [Raineyella antarctica]SDB80379.1 ATP-dependent helicase HrpB [Raineyella antarctica]